MTIASFLLTLLTGIVIVRFDNNQQRLIILKYLLNHGPVAFYFLITF